MAKVTKAIAKKTTNWEFPFVDKNFIYLGAGLAIILIGYLLMATGITETPAAVDGKWNNVLAVLVAPFVLVFGYCVAIPYAILKFFKDDKSTESGN